MLLVSVNPDILRWARERAGLRMEDLQGRFKKLALWERGEGKPTLKQLEEFAKAVSVPVGYLFLAEPPQEKVPIPDLRTMGGDAISAPSPDLLEVLYLCQRRQAWYRDYAHTVGEKSCRFVGSASLDTPIEETAASMRQTLNLDLETQRTCPTWTEALRRFIVQAEQMGVLVMVSGVVGNNNRRKLDPEEFRGFALVDDLAPIVFINGADTKAAQLFTLAHELAHLWLGESALSDAKPYALPSHRVERWCNQVAAEFLVPEKAFREVLPKFSPLEHLQDLARQFKVSALVILRRMYDVGCITRNTFHEAYDKELQRLQSLPKSSGGSFYLTQEARASRRFVHALVVSTLEGQTLYRDAFQLLGIKKEKTFVQFGMRIGVMA